MCPVYVVKDVTGPYLLPPLPLGEDSGEGALSIIELSLTHSLSQRARVMDIRRGSARCLVTIMILSW